MKNFLLIFVFLLGVQLSSCGTPEDNRKARLMAGSKDQIIARSGTTFRNDDRAFKDAQNRLMSGGGLFGKKGLAVEDLFGQQTEQSSTSIGLPINAILWKSSLETISFMPIASADPFAGLIITDWYNSPQNIDERCKINIFIKGKELKSDNLSVNTFCQNRNNNLWVDIDTKKENSTKIENAILNKAKKIKLALN